MVKEKEKDSFLNTLEKKITDTVPLYCTGYPDSEFIRNYINAYGIKSEKDKNLILNKNDYSTIKQIGFDAISIWDFRRGTGGFKISNELRVDGWGRIFRENWYQNDGVFKDENILEKWEHLTLPSKKTIEILKNFLKNVKSKLDLEPVLSLPGLFEKTWQSMGLLFFSKCLRYNNIGYIKKVISFFFNYLKELINILTHGAGAKIFLVADDCGYKKRLFISKKVWRRLFFDKYKEITKIVHEKNRKIIIHSDGYVSNLIDVFVNIGFDAVQSLESSAGVDIFSIFKKFGNKQICFIGNLDVSELIYGTPEKVKKYVEKLIFCAKKYKCPLVISPTQQINSKVKPRNIKIMIETARMFSC